MAEEHQSVEFLQVQKDSMEVLGFWSEWHKQTVIQALEAAVDPEITKVWCIADFVVNGDKVLVKWKRKILV